MSDAGKPLLPANVTLLQPGSRAYRLYDALNYGQVVNQGLQKQLTYLNNQVATLQSQIATLQSQMATANSNISTLQSQMATANTNITNLQSTTTSLQNQINTINSRLAAAGIP